MTRGELLKIIEQNGKDYKDSLCNLDLVKTKLNYEKG
jgi:hypothetical protein